MNEKQKIELGKTRLSYLETNMKTCTNCNIEKPITEFFKKALKRGLGYRSHCKECAHLLKFKSKENFEEIRTQYKQRKTIRANEYRKMANYSQWDKSKNRLLKCKYGISLHDYNEMIKAQDNKCYICKFETKLVVDHCHKSNEVRKLLCDNCNKTLGIIKENRETLKNMLQYLREHQPACPYCEKSCQQDHCAWKDKNG